MEHFSLNLSQGLLLPYSWAVQNSHTESYEHDFNRTSYLTPHPEIAGTPGNTAVLALLTTDKPPRLESLSNLNLNYLSSSDQWNCSGVGTKENYLYLKKKPLNKPIMLGALFDKASTILSSKMSLCLPPGLMRFRYKYPVAHQGWMPFHHPDIRRRRSKVSTFRRNL